MSLRVALELRSAGVSEEGLELARSTRAHLKIRLDQLQDPALCVLVGGFWPIVPVEHQPDVKTGTTCLDSSTAESL